MCASNHQNQQLYLRQKKTCLSSKTNCSVFHSTICWSLFHPRTCWSPFHTSAHLHTCTFNPDVRRVYHLYCVSWPTTSILEGGLCKRVVPSCVPLSSFLCFSPSRWPSPDQSSSLLPHLTHTTVCVLYHVERDCMERFF